jgi:hypothetical protein
MCFFGSPAFFAACLPFEYSDGAEAWFGTEHQGMLLPGQAHEARHQEVEASLSANGCSDHCNASSASSRQKRRVVGPKKKYLYNPAGKASLLKFDGSLNQLDRIVARDLRIESPLLNSA